MAAGAQTLHRRLRPPAGATLRLLDYPGWRVTVDQRLAPSRQLPEASAAPPSHNRTGQLIVAVPAGDSQVEVCFGPTPDRVAGNMISLFGVLGWAGLRCAPAGG